VDSIQQAETPPAQRQPAVVVNNIRKVFEDEGRGLVEAVAGISFECYPGEIFGLLGANGAGKTTTLRMLSTLIKPTSGTASIQGFNVQTHPLEVRSSLGFYSASTALYPRLSARETLGFFAELNGIPRAQVKVRVEELIERFGLGKYADARVERLSSGMKQKVSIARTVAHNPPVLIFDEPTVGLDIVNALEFQSSLAELRDQGKAIILSTHIMSEAEKLCDRIAIVVGGRMLTCGSLSELRQRTSLHYLEEIFVHYLTGKANQETIA
jgi:sodium transport system ATP-binding protein